MIQRGCILREFSFLCITIIAFYNDQRQYLLVTPCADTEIWYFSCIYNQFDSEPNQGHIIITYSVLFLRYYRPPSIYLSNSHSFFSQRAFSEPTPHLEHHTLSLYPMSLPLFCETDSELSQNISVMPIQNACSPCYTNS